LGSEFKQAIPDEARKLAPVSKMDCALVRKHRAVKAVSGKMTMVIARRVNGARI
jgi:hypothetical protein